MSNRDPTRSNSHYYPGVVVQELQSIRSELSQTRNELEVVKNELETMKDAMENLRETALTLTSDVINEVLRAESSLLSQMQGFFGDAQRHSATASQCPAPADMQVDPVLADDPPLVHNQTGPLISPQTGPSINDQTGASNNVQASNGNAPTRFSGHPDNTSAITRPSSSAPVPSYRFDSSARSVSSTWREYKGTGEFSSLQGGIKTLILRYGQKWRADYEPKIVQYFSRYLFIIHYAEKEMRTRPEAVVLQELDDLAKCGHGFLSSATIKKKIQKKQQTLNNELCT